MKNSTPQKLRPRHAANTSIPLHSPTNRTFSHLQGDNSVSNFTEKVAASPQRFEARSARSVKSHTAGGSVPRNAADPQNVFRKMNRIMQRIGELKQSADLSPQPMPSKVSMNSNVSRFLPKSQSQLGGKPKSTQGGALHARDAQLAPKDEERWQKFRDSVAHIKALTQGVRQALGQLQLQQRVDSEKENETLSNFKTEVASRRNLYSNAENYIANMNQELRSRSQRSFQQPPTNPKVAFPDSDSAKVNSFHGSDRLAPPSKLAPGRNPNFPLTKTIDGRRNSNLSGFLATDGMDREFLNSPRYQNHQNHQNYQTQQFHQGQRTQLVNQPYQTTYLLPNPERSNSGDFFRSQKHTQDDDLQSLAQRIQHAQTFSENTRTRWAQLDQDFAASEGHGSFAAHVGNKMNHSSESDRKGSFNFTDFEINAKEQTQKIFHKSNFHQNQNYEIPNYEIQDDHDFDLHQEQEQPHEEQSAAKNDFVQQSSTSSFNDSDPSILDIQNKIAELN